MRIGPLQKSVVDGPKISNKVHLRQPGKDPSIFPVAKYVFIAKSFESKKFYKIHGIPRRTKVYGVGVLTEKNEYYYSELHTRHQELTSSNRELFQMVLTSKYRFTEKTMVSFTDNINHKDPICAFVTIVGSAIGYHTKFTNFAKMTRVINNKFRLVKNVSKGNYSTHKWHAKAVLNKLIELKRFEFITDPSWYEKISTKAANAKLAYLLCATGIFYLYTKDISMKYYKAMKDHQAQRKIEELRKQEENKQ